MKISHEINVTSSFHLRGDVANTNSFLLVASTNKNYESDELFSFKFQTNITTNISNFIAVAETVDMNDII